MNASIQYRLQHQFAQVEDLLAPLSVDFIRRRHLPDKWSIHENIAHLGRYQEMFMERIERILSEEMPLMDRYVAENDPLFLNWVEKEPGEILRKSATKRTTFRQHLESLNAAQLSRQGIHPKFGKMNVAEWTEFFLLHESHHLYAIFRLIRAHGD